MTNTFTVAGSPTFSSGKYGNALTPSSGNYLTFGNAAAFQSSTGLTVEYWMKTSSTGSFEGIFCRAGFEWFGVTGGKLFSPMTWIIDVTVSDGQWHHVAWTFDGSNVRCFLDGAQAASVASNATSLFWPSSGNGSKLIIGARTDSADGTGIGSPFVGQIDDLRISKTVRYSGNFTPPATTHTGDANTLGLYRLEADGTDSAADLTPPSGSPIPGPPTSISATPTTGQVALSWTAATDDVAVVGYRIYRRGVQVGTTTGTSFTETGLASGVRVEYRLTAYDGDGNESAQSPIVAATTPLALKSGAPKVIFDADMSSDIDDVGAIATLHALADLGECEIIGMGVSSTNGGTAEMMDAVNTYYGRPSIPVAVRPDVGGIGGYPGTVASEFPHDLAYTAAPTAVTSYRTLLAAAGSASVVIVTAGYLTNLSALLNSPADGISGLTGSQLIAAKVKAWVPMGGVYPSGSEFNFMSAGDGGAAAFNVVNNWPTAAIYSGFEIGSPIYTGGESLFAQTPTSNPIRRAWEVFHDPIARASFDQTAVYAALRLAEGLFGSVTVGRNNTNSDGSNFWTASPDPSGATEQQYLLEKVRYPVQQVIDALMCAVPGASAPGVPTQPTNLRATAVSAGSSITLAWTSNSFNESGFSIERRDNTTGAYSEIGTVSAGTTTYADSGLSSTTNRAYRVRATSSRGNSPYATLSVFSGWTETNLNTSGNVPIYTVTGNHLRYARATAEDHITVCDDSTHGTTVTVTTDAATVGAGGSSLIYFLYQDASNWYRLNVSDSATKFEKRVSGVTSQVGSAGAGISMGSGTKMQAWRVALTPGSMTFTSPTVTLTATDTLAFSSGKVGFGGLSRGPLWQNITIAGATAAVTPALSNTAVPTIAGTAQTGQTLTASAGSWSATPDSFTRQWNRGGTPIAGATGAAYVVQSADVGQQVTVTVTAAKAGYTSASATSAPVVPAAAGGTPSPLSNTALPTISGAAQQGQTLTAGPGTWNVDPDSFGYQWKRGGVNISGATSSTYLLVSADVGSTITVTVTAAKVGYTSASATSAATATVIAPGAGTSSSQVFVNRGGTFVPLGGTGIPSATAVAKGDMLVATGPGVFTRLPVGVAGQVPKADPSTPTGWAWAADNATTGGATSSTQVWPATYSADSPPAGLAAVTFNNTTDDAPALQALMQYVKNTWGGGHVILSKPSANGNPAVRIASGLNVPSKVQLVSDETTLINSTAISSGAPITVNDSDFTPLVGIRMDGGLFTPTTGDLGSSYTGVKVTGNGLKFEKLHLQYFGRGVDTSASNTWSVVFEDSSAERCAVGWYSDLNTSGASNSGERNTWRGGGLNNNVLGVWGGGGGQHLRLESTSLDFNKVAGKFDNCKPFLQGVHLEMNASDGVDYCFEVTVNTQFNVCQMEGVLGAGLYKMFRNDGGSTYAPWNTGFGQARWKQADIFYTDQSSAAGTKTSEQEFTFPSGTTTTTVHFPFPGQWCAPTAKFLASHDGLYVTPLSTTNGTYTLTASASSGSNRQCRIDFG